LLKLVLFIFCVAFKVYHQIIVERSVESIQADCESVRKLILSISVNK